MFAPRSRWLVAGSLATLSACTTTFYGETSGPTDAAPTGSIDAAAPDATPPVAPDAALPLAACPDAATVDLLTGHCYLLVELGPGIHAAKTWIDAAQDCAARGPFWHLVSFEDPAEFGRLHGAPIFHAAGEMWIGLADGVTEGSFRWITGSPLSFGKWYPGEPNDDNGGEDCGMQYASPAGEPGWNDAVCSYPAPYMCERDTP